MDKSEELELECEMKDAARFKSHSRTDTSSDDMELFQKLHTLEC